MYQLRAPAPELGRFIEHYWFVTHEPSQPVELKVDVFVDGRADLIFNFGAPYVRQVLGGATREIARSNLDAQRLVPIRILQRGEVRTTGVRFRLGGLGPFVRQSLRALTNTTKAPEEVFGAEAGALEEALRHSQEIDPQARLLDDFFRRELRIDASFEAFARALSVSIESDGAASLADLALGAGSSARQVERLFARHLGIPPKTLGRVLRFQHALRALMRDPRCALADVAASAGYFDHAHFIKDFRRLSGGVPRGYRGYYPPEGPADFAPNVVVFLQESGADLR